MQKNRSNQKKLAFFTERMNEFDSQKIQREKISKWVSYARFITFSIAAVLIISGLDMPFSWKNLNLVSGFFCLCLFCVLLFIHHMLFETIKALKFLSQINRDSISRMKRNWDSLTQPAIPQKYLTHPLSCDLDIITQKVGSVSLLKCLGPVHTGSGIKTLMNWLYQPSCEKEIALRQQAVKELADQVTWRQTIDLHGRMLPNPAPGINPFLNWAEGKPWLLEKKFILILVLFSSIAPTLLALANILGILPPYWIIAILINLVICAMAGNKCHHYFDRISSTGRVFKLYARIITDFTQNNYTSALLKNLKDTLTGNNISASNQIKRFDQWVSLADVRCSSMVYPFLMGFFLWPFPVLMGFELWQKHAGCHVRKWFETLGIMESISSLATLKFENPEWVFPTVKKHYERIEVENIGHPLLHPDSCIENSLVIGPEDTFQMVTGSNMSGKSTLLRAIGLNSILAQAGAPVYAKKMTLPEISLGTSFRIQDSLESGVSFFMAELKRLKEIVDQAEDLNQNHHGKTLYLLDEILQGTNSVERQIAVRHIINRLINLKSIGIISTHDLSLAETEELKEKCQLLHFTEHYKKTESGDIMQFDYKLKHGLAPTVNALKLLEIIGLLDEKR